MLRTYSEMILLPSFEERFRYLRLGGGVGHETFGFDRYLNQAFYRSPEWRHLRDQIILRDSGCDLAVLDRPIFGKTVIHHLNPVGVEDIVNQSDLLLNPEYLVCVSHATHNAIHYGDVYQVLCLPADRSPNDTCPWKG